GGKTVVVRRRMCAGGEYRAMLSARLRGRGHAPCRARSRDVRDRRRVPACDPTHACDSRSRADLPSVLQNTRRGNSTGRPNTHLHTAVASNTRYATPSVHSVGTSSPRPTRSTGLAAAAHDTPVAVGGGGRGCVRSPPGRWG